MYVISVFTTHIHIFICLGYVQMMTIFSQKINSKIKCPQLYMYLSTGFIAFLKTISKTSMGLYIFLIKDNFIPTEF